MAKSVALLLLAAAFAAVPRGASAQQVTVGGGALLSDRPVQPVAELHASAPPLAGVRGYTTWSWTDESARPAVIAAAERSLVRTPISFTGLGAGVLCVDPNDYRPQPMVVSTTVVPLPVPRTAAVAIGSVLPFEDFDWSLVLKVGVSLVSGG